MIRRLDGVLHGDYRTLFRGYGLDLADLREYEYGDDVRHIDWNVTARLTIPYVREYNEEREVAAWFLLDLSASVDFGSQDTKKQAVSTEFVAVLARILTRHGNRVGALFYGDRVDTVIPARSGRRQVLHLLHRMQNRPARAQSGATNLGELLSTRLRDGAAALADVRRLRFHQHARAGPSRSPISRSGMTSSRCASTIRWRWSCPISACSSCRTPRPASSCSSTRTTRASAGASQRRPRRARRSSARPSPMPASTRSSSSTNDDLVDAILRFADLRKRRSQLATGGGLPQHLGVQLHDASVAGDAVAAAARAGGRRRVPRSAAAEEEGRAALREPLDHARGAERRSSASGATCRRSCSSLALTLMIVAIARPTAVVTLPSQHETVILAMDVSGSMRATDVKPSRIVAAQEAASAFVAEQPKTTRIGVVSFAATASVVQSPTHSREDILAAIDRFQLQRGTAVGSGILVSLKMIFPDAEFDLRSSNPRRDAARASRSTRARRAGQGGTDKPVPPGSYTSAAIILLTDGQTTTGPDPIESARMAADRGVRVYTVGIGTQSGEMIGAEGWSMRVRLDEQALKTIANLTHGEYFYAGTAADLQKIYKNLNTKLFFEQKETEITALFAAAAAALALLSALLSLLWFNRIL